MVWGLKKKGRITLFIILLFMLIGAVVVDCWLQYPKKIIIFEGEALTLSSESAYYADVPAGVSGVLSETGVLQSDIYNRTVTANETGDYQVTLKLFDVIPVRTVTVDVQPQQEVLACGNAIGIKIFTKGLVCVGIQEIQAENGQIYNVAQKQDFRTGDILLSANGTELATTEQLGELIAGSGGAEISFSILRDNKELVRKASPVLTQEGYKLGLWVRDSTAGIGTLTYCDPETKGFGALGHPIADADTSVIMPVSEGALLKATILGVEKGKKGEPGELKGIFSGAEDPIGTITKNTPRGVFGTLYEGTAANNRYTLASGSQVKEGTAQILSNISGERVEAFDVEIQKIMRYRSGDYKDMVIRITDPDLLDATGGIVQGMSGSPIVQNGKLVGAVTHVFVNDPTRGYGIFIENMLAEAEKIM